MGNCDYISLLYKINVIHFCFHILICSLYCIFTIFPAWRNKGEVAVEVHISENLNIEICLWKTNDAYPGNYNKFISVLKWISTDTWND